MSRKYTFSIQFGDETFQAEGFDSFDEAIKVVEKAVYDRKLAKGGDYTKYNIQRKNTATPLPSSLGGDQVFDESSVRGNSLGQTKVSQGSDNQSSSSVLPPPPVSTGRTFRDQI